MMIAIILMMKNNVFPISFLRFLAFRFLFLNTSESSWCLCFLLLWWCLWLLLLSPLLLWWCLWLLLLSLLLLSLLLWCEWWWCWCECWVSSSDNVFSSFVTDFSSPVKGFSSPIKDFSSSVIISFLYAFCLGYWTWWEPMGKAPTTCLSFFWC